MGCIQSGNRPGLYDDHELIDNLNFEADENLDMALEDDALIAAADDIVGSNSTLRNADRHQSRILTNEEIQRITRDKMAKIIAEQQHHDVIVDAALAQADEDQRLEEEAEIQSMRLRGANRLAGEKISVPDVDQEGFMTTVLETNDEDFDSFLEDVKNKSLLHKVSSLTNIPDTFPQKNAAIRDTLNDTVVSLSSDTFDEFIAAPPSSLDSSSTVTSRAPEQSKITIDKSDKRREEKGECLGTRAMPPSGSIASLDQGLDLDLPDLRPNDKLAASHTDFSFAESV